MKFPAFHAAQTEVNLEEKSKVEQQTVNQTEQKPEKKNSIRKQLAEKKKECEERDAKQQLSLIHISDGNGKKKNSGQRSKS